MQRIGSTGAPKSGSQLTSAPKSGSQLKTPKVMISFVINILFTIISVAFAG